jgi:isopenicillin-N N-acyltransferase like protein
MAITDKSATVTIKERQMSGAQAFPFFRFTGTHREIGRQFGEACQDLIIQHRDKALARLEQKNRISAGRARSAAAEYRNTVVEYAPFFDEEIQGLAEGAGIDLSDAYLLQLRAELGVTTPADLDDDASECTTFAALPEATSNGKPIIGQNADLPAFYGEISVVVELVPDDQPTVLMVTPAGQMSYIGINDRGMGVFANFVTCDGWRIGFPRYFLSRLALTHERVDDAVTAIRSVPRASSRNLIMIDSHGTAVDLETTPTRDARIEPVDGLLAHSNHYVAPELADEERSKGRQLENSRKRLERMIALLRERHGQLDHVQMKAIMRDRVDVPDALCREHGDEDSDMMTFASVIAEPADRAMWIAMGPPNKYPYRRYEIGKTQYIPAEKAKLLSRMEV